jgi:hypothetical protein
MRVYTDAGGRSYGFLLDDDVFTTIDVPGTVRTQPHGINNLGQIVGKYLDDAGRFHGFLLDNSNFTTFAAPGTLGESYPRDIDDRGRMVGFYQ